MLGCTHNRICSGDDMMHPTARLTQFLTDPETAKSQEPNKAPHNIANKTDLPLHMWLQRPENILSLKRLQHGMQSLIGPDSETLSSGGEYSRTF